jgi:hypothetical protein
MNGQYSPMEEQNNHKLDDEQQCVEDIALVISPRKSVWSVLFNIFFTPLTVLIWFIVPVAFGSTNGLFIIIGTILASVFLWSIMEKLETALQLVLWSEIFLTVIYMANKEGPMDWLKQGIKDWFNWLTQHFT